MTATLLDDIARRLGALPPDERKEVERLALAATADMVWIPNPGAQTDAYFCKADVLLYGGAGGGGKALALDTLLPTPHGWTTMGAVAVGDWVFDESGHPCRVVAATAVMAGRPCYRVTFSDGAEIVADAEHGWLTMTQRERDRALCLTPEWRERRRAARPSRAKPNPQKPWTVAGLTERNRAREHIFKAPPVGAVRTTEEIARSLTRGARAGANHSVAVAGALALPPAMLPIDPYVLGLWLGDGSSYKAEITTADAEIVGSLVAAGYDVRKYEGQSYAYGVRGGLKVALREAGLIANKHIPVAYLRASEEQRLALLQGLMDTDGYCDERGQCEFTTTNGNLADAVQELLASLGIKVAISEGVAKLQGRAIGPKYRLKFITDKPAFRLPRKLARQKRSGFRGTHARRYIVSVEPVESVPVRCIEVDSPSHLYLAGRQMVPTHNSDLGLGLAFTAHQRSLIMRRRYANLSALTERAKKINGGGDGFNGSPPPLLRTKDGRYIQFGANQHPGDEEDWQGHPFDLKYFDEATQFLESQVRFHLGWLRPSDGYTGRCRAVLGSNPPLSADGDWIVGMFRPWLDLTHPKPAKPGELRWFVTAPDGSDLEVDGPQPVQLPGQTRALKPLSRSFIPAKLSDNPFLVNTDYGAKLDGLPEPLRSAIRDGNFMAMRQDAEWQVIPTDWVVQAQARWRPDGWKDFAMTAMALDPAGGGKDSEELIWRHGPWFAQPVSAVGEKTAGAQGAVTAIFLNRRDEAPVVIDAGGGYAGPVIQRLEDNGVAFERFNGASSGHGRAEKINLPFANKRAEALWRLREALDPSRPGGSEIALPPDPELRADLTAPTYDAKAMEQRGVILIESKDSLRKRLGRSPGKGDVVAMCWASGGAARAAQVKKFKQVRKTNYNTSPPGGRWQQRRA